MYLCRKRYLIFRDGLSALDARENHSGAVIALSAFFPQYRHGSKATAPYSV